MKNKNKNNWKFGGKFWRFHPKRIILDIAFLGPIYYMMNLASDNRLDPTLWFILFFGYIIIRIWEIIYGSL